MFIRVSDPRFLTDLLTRPRSGGYAAEVASESIIRLSDGVSREPLEALLYDWENSRDGVRAKIVE